MCGVSYSPEQKNTTSLTALSLAILNKLVSLSPVERARDREEQEVCVY